MSLLWMGQAWSIDFGSTPRKMIALAIADCHNEETNRCFPGAEHISRKVNLEVGNVRRHIATLIEEGWLAKDDRNYRRGDRWFDELDAQNRAFDARNRAPERAESRAKARGTARVIRKEPELEPEAESTAAVRSEVVERDPVHDLVKMAWDKRVADGKPRPALRTDGKGNPFMALVGIARQLVDSGHPAQDIGLAIYDNGPVWTMAALQLTLARLQEGRPNDRRLAGMIRDNKLDAEVVDINRVMGWS